MKITKESPRIGATIEEIDINNLSSDDIATIKNIIYEYKVVSIPQSPLDLNSFQTFVKKLGSLISHKLTKSIDLAYPYADIVYRKASDKGVLFGGSWHSDGSFEENPPDFTCLYGEIIPSVKNTTLFADCVDAYHQLDTDLKTRLISLQAIHTPEKLCNTRFESTELSENFIENMSIQNIHPVIKYHPYKNEPYLNINHLYTSSITNMDEEESNDLLIRLFNDQVKNVYEVNWSPHMILIWDNRLVIHKAVRCAGHDRKIIRYLVRDSLK
jgi:taurine dioxygenase